MTNGQQFNPSRLHSETSIKTTKWQVQRAARLMLLPWRLLGRVVHLERTWKVQAPSHKPCPVHLFHLFLSCILYNKPAIVSKMFSWILWAVLANYWTWWEWGLQEPWPYQPVSQKYGRPETCNWHLKWGRGRQSCGTEPLACGSDSNSRYIVSELNWIVCVRQQRTGWCVWEKIVHIWCQRCCE